MKNGLIAAGETLLSRAAHALEHHPKHVTAALAAVMLSGGGGAFAVASIQPQEQHVVVRQVLESVAALPIKSQLQALDAHSFNLFRSETTRANDTVESLLSRAGVADAQAAAFLRAHYTFRTQVVGAAGRAVTIEASESHELRKLTARWVSGNDGTFKRLIVERTGPAEFTSEKRRITPTATT